MVEHADMCFLLGVHVRHDVVGSKATFLPAPVCLRVLVCQWERSLLLMRRRLQQRFLSLLSLFARPSPPMQREPDASLELIPAQPFGKDVSCLSGGVHLDDPGLSFFFSNMSLEAAAFDCDPFGPQIDLWRCGHGERGAAVLKRCRFHSGLGARSWVHALLHFSQKGPHGQQLFCCLTQSNEIWLAGGGGRHLLQL